MRVKQLLAVMVFLFYAGTASAKYTQSCHIKYETKEGWSDYYYVEVKFMSGKEMNDATKTYDYEYYFDYAVIFWGEDKATIIKINSYVYYREVLERSDIVDNRYDSIKGKDKDGTEWQICTQSRCS